jgi:GR25 family glycosyltransferase involved in LPS biosynthesis
MFEAAYCLNMQHRPDRWKLTKDQCDTLGINVTRVEGVPPSTPERPGPHISFCLGMLKMIEKALDDAHQTVLLLEDDVHFVHPELITYCEKELPEHWAIFYLGANLQNVHSLPERHSFHLWRVYNAWTSHAVAYQYEALEFIHDRYRKVLEGIVYNHVEFTTSLMYDAWLGREILPAVKAYVAIPNIAHQYPGYSDIWGHEVNYTELFN